MDLAALHADPRLTWVEDVLRYADLDINRHVNNSVFSVLCESGRVNLFRTRFGEDETGDGYFVVAKLVIEFKAELHYPGRVRTGTWVRHVGRSSIGLAQVLEGDGGLLAATSEAVCVFMSRATRRPAPLSDTRRRIATELLRPDLPA
ncbi:MAG: fcbC [Enterovirga sp.]|jgi:acyl-CoA thioester hydrolase|nr:fcbC [Enterovirga sp.]